MTAKQIPFSPPDITEREIDEVVDTLRSGWITTGPKTKLFEREIAAYCGAEKAVGLNSATAGLELSLRLFGIGEGDEVITTPYTYCATANVIHHVGARPVFADVKPGEFNIDPLQIAENVTERTKAVIAVDFGGYPCDYDEIAAVLEERRRIFRPRSGTWQTELRKPLFISDAAHAFGASYRGRKTGVHADITVFSFHAVKNLTTAEGGAVVFGAIGGLTPDEIYREFVLMSLHGQSKDALAKFQGGTWRYDVVRAGYKCNMTDIQAALGLAQLRRYENEILPARRRICERYLQNLSSHPRLIMPPFSDPHKIPSYHLFPLRIRDAEERDRDLIIEAMAGHNISVNVHFIPVVQHSFYRGLGYAIQNFPRTYDMYKNEVSLPVYSALSLSDVDVVCRALNDALLELPKT
jgi:dTDP-4-amino-4,6-dideoxygalactose transaminase